MEQLIFWYSVRERSEERNSSEREQLKETVVSLRIGVEQNSQEEQRVLS